MISTKQTSWVETISTQAYVQRLSARRQYTPTRRYINLSVEMILTQSACQTALGRDDLDPSLSKNNDWVETISAQGWRIISTRSRETRPNPVAQQALGRDDLNPSLSNNQQSEPKPPFPGALEQCTSSDPKDIPRTWHTWHVKDSTRSRHPIWDVIQEI